MRQRIRTAAWLLLLAWLASLPAAAQQLERRDTVAQRSRPGVDADGMPLGAWRLYPELGLELRYDDNVFADDQFEESDTATIVRPELRLENRASRYRALLGANADIARYADFDSEDYTDLRGWLLGDMQLGEGELRGELRYGKLHEDRSSPDDLRGTELTEFSRRDARLAYGYRPGRLLLRADAGFHTLDFDATQTAAGLVSNDDRDRDLLEFGLRGGYSVSPDLALYAEGRIDQIDYDLARDRDGFERSSDGWELRFGGLLDFTGRTAGEFYVGYQSRDYDDPRFSDARGPSLGGEVSWNMSGLTTLTISGSRHIDSTTVVGASGITKSQLAFGLDHELLRKLILTVEAEVANDDFEGLERNDDLARVELRGRYLANRFLQLLFGYRYRQRDSSPANAAGREYRINEIYLRVTGQL